MALNREQAITQARAQMTWGEAPKDILEFLQGQGFYEKEAYELLADLQRERDGDVRVVGLRKLLLGGGLLLIPIATVIFFLTTGWVHSKILALTIAIGLFGVYKLVGGALLIFAPEQERGDFSSLAE